MLKIVNSQFFIDLQISFVITVVFLCLCFCLCFCLISLDSLIRFRLGVTCATSLIRLLMHIIVIHIIVTIISIPICILTIGIYT